MLATDELVEEEAQRSRLEERLPRWLERVPLYRGMGQGQRRLIGKADIRRNFPKNFLGEDVDLEDLVEREEIELEHTAGTSEDRTPLLLPRGWWVEQEAKALRLNPLVARVMDAEPEARRVTITSPVCSGDIRYTGTPPWSERVLGNSLFVNLSRYPFLWSEAELARMAAEAKAWKPRFLDLDPVYGVVFALYCERKGIRLEELAFVFCSYEFLSLTHRRILQRAFQVPVYNLYGSTETGHLLMEDEAGKMRPSYETACLEIVNADERDIGDLVVTTLTNDWMPLLGYRIGDLAERRQNPSGTRYVVHGRASDAFVRPTGRRVTIWEIDQCFSNAKGIAHYQLIEGVKGNWRLKFIAEQKGPSHETITRLTGRLSDLLGLDSRIAPEQTELLVPEGSGKFRLGYPAPKVT